MNRIRGFTARDAAKSGAQKSANRLVSLGLPSRSSIMWSRRKPSTPSSNRPSRFGSTSDTNRLSMSRCTPGSRRLTVATGIILPSYEGSAVRPKMIGSGTELVESL